jgi:hypothetical protein
MSIVLIQHLADGQVKQIPLTQRGIKLRAIPDARYEVLDTQTGKTPTGMVVKKAGSHLVLDFEGQEISAEVTDFYTHGSDPSFKFPDISQGGGGQAGIAPTGTELAGLDQSVIPASAPVVSDTGTTDQGGWIAGISGALGIFLGWGGGGGTTSVPLAETTVTPAVGPSVQPPPAAQPEPQPQPALPSPAPVTVPTPPVENPEPEVPSDPEVQQSASIAVVVKVVAGPIISPLKVVLFDAEGHAIATGTTDANGNITLNIDRTYTGTIIAVASSLNGTSPDYLDETTGDIDLPIPLRAATVANGEALSISLTPLTEFAVREILAENQAPDAALVQATNDAVGDLFGVKIITGPVVAVNDAAFAAAAEPAKSYGYALAALSGADQKSGGMDQTLQMISDGVTGTGGDLKWTDDEATLAVLQGAVTAGNALHIDVLMSLRSQMFDSGVDNADSGFDRTPPAAPSAGNVTAENGKNASSEIAGGINAAEAANGTKVVFALPADIAKGDILAVTLPGSKDDQAQNIYHFVTSGEVTAGYATVVLSVAQVAYMGEGPKELVANVIDAAGNISTNPVAAIGFTIDTVKPAAVASNVALGTDRGASPTDFITNTASQTITATLSAGLATGEGLKASLDGGAHWIDISDKVSGTAVTWTSAVLSDSGTLKLRVEDGTGNIGTVLSQDYTVDTTAPTTKLDSVSYTFDKGFTGTLSAALLINEALKASLDDGVTWTDITNKISGAAMAWIGAPVTGSGVVIFRVEDLAGNAGPEITGSYKTPANAVTTIVSELALSADSGASATDFITNIASQTITATLSAGLATGEILKASLDGGASWSDISDKVSDRAVTWTGATLSDSGTLKLRVEDGAGNIGTVLSQDYTVDTTAPTTQLVSAGYDTHLGLTGTLSAALLTNEVFKVSLDDGVTWTDATDKVSGTKVAWIGVPLIGSSIMKFKVEDLAGNAGPEESSAYDSPATFPTTSVSASAFSADSGASPTDFITRTKEQTISATLSAKLAEGEELWASLDGGATWINITDKVDDTAVEWHVTLEASGTLKMKVENVFHLAGPVLTQDYKLDMLAPVTSFNEVTYSGADGITATLSSALSDGDVVKGSLDKGATWTDITSKVTGTQFKWNVVLAGSSTFRICVEDMAGNIGPTLTRDYPLSTATPATILSKLSFSNDNGTSNADFITNSAEQTITATLSNNLKLGQLLKGSLDNGVKWIDLTDSVDGNVVRWSDVRLESSDTLKLRVENASGDAGPVFTQQYELSYILPTTTVSGLEMSADSGVSNSDFITAESIQTVTATLSKKLTAGEVLKGSLDNGDHWTDITEMVSGKAVSWTGVTLDRSGVLMLRVENTAGNSGPEESRSYIFDATAPVTGFLEMASYADGAGVSATLNADLAMDERLTASLDGGNNWTDITDKRAGTSVTWDGVSLTGNGMLKMRVEDEAGNGGLPLELRYTHNAHDDLLAVFSVAADGKLSLGEFAKGVTIRGTAEANAEVEVTWECVTKTETKTVTADSAGAWSAMFKTGELPVHPDESLLDTFVTVTASKGTADEVKVQQTVTVDFSDYGRASEWSAMSGYGMLDIERALEVATGKPIDHEEEHHSKNPDVAANFDWGVNAIHAPNAWKAGYTGKDVVIAILDTGLDIDLEDDKTRLDFRGHLWVNPLDPTVDGIDDDNNGYVDDVHGVDIINHDGNPDDMHGHGTHAAGIAAGSGMAAMKGVAPDAQLMAVKVFNGHQSDAESLIAGINYAVGHGADILSLSLSLNERSQGVFEAIQDARKQGKIVLMAASNEGEPEPDYPAFDAGTSGGLAVGAVDSDHHMAWFSNQAGAAPMPYIVAPGNDIWSTWPTDTGSLYSPQNGTSMATPFVAGAAALLLSAKSDWLTSWNSDLLENLLVTTATPLLV